VQRSSIGVGPALRKARQARGVSIAEASRDTRIREQFIRALEGEDFDRLLGDVYVRGALRTYSTYLGVPADRVLARYATSMGEPAPAPPGPPAPTEPVVGAPRHRDNHVLIGMIAAIVVAAVAFGILSPHHSAPTAATSLPMTSAGPAEAPGISLSVSTATQPVDVMVRQDDGDPVAFRLLPGESRAFVANSTLTIRISEGATADVVVSGKDLGTPGRSSRPWTYTYSYGTGPAGP